MFGGGGFSVHNLHVWGEVAGSREFKGELKGKRWRGVMENIHQIELI